MMKFNAFQIFWFCTLMQGMAAVLCHGLEPVEVWFENLKKPSAPKTTVIEFYAQDFQAGPRQSMWQIAQASITPTSPTNFGALLMSEALITVGPDLNSAPMGRGQGLVAYSDLNEPVVSFMSNLIFTSGEYNGSTLSLTGRNPLSRDARELSITGGTGVFRLARGIAITSTYSDFDATTGYGVFKYTLYVIYPYLV